MDFTKENLVKFEMEFFSIPKPEKYRNHMWYGQALNLEFNFDELFGESLAQEPHDRYSQYIAWLMVK